MKEWFILLLSVIAREPPYFEPGAGAKVEPSGARAILAVLARRYDAFESKEFSFTGFEARHRRQAGPGEGATGVLQNTLIAVGSAASGAGAAIAVWQVANAVVAIAGAIAIFLLFVIALARGSN